MKPYSFHRKLEEIDNKNTFEIDSLKQEIANLKNDKKELNHQIDQLNRQIERKLKPSNRLFNTVR